ncbi:MAG: TRAP transporter fused permease subunit [Deltaproteobacteria bacterium]|nr:TRAP transporter fused permease subunit [Deltaproteobacteria bacterium]
MAELSELEIVDVTRYVRVPKIIKFLFIVATIAGIALSVIHIFGIVIQGKVLLSFAYYYLLFAFFFPFVFILIPMHDKAQEVPWYDMVLAVLTFGICIYFFINAWAISVTGWIPASPFNLLLGLIFTILAMEGGRRTGGSIYVIISAVIGLYPIIAEYMPGVLWGRSFSVHETLSYIAYGGDSFRGLPAAVLGELLIGFLLFAAVLLSSGAGRFFLNFAMAIAGKFRGGPAKVSVISSAFFGTLSGNVFANIVATGSVTIPTMKRLGYPPHYAGAIEACASSGGMIMPPVMGLLAFVMCAYLNIEYAVVMVAAAIPAILYFLGLLMQVDAYAAKVGLKGLPPEEVPSLIKTLKEGWPFLFVFVFLIWGLVYMKWETRAPFYASGLMVILSYTNRKTAMTFTRFINTIRAIGSLVSQTLGILLPIGVLTCGLVLTGTSARMTALLVSIGGDSPFILLLIGAAVCYVLGMAGVLVPAYIFLAVTLVPALIKAGNMNVLAVHLFIIYYVNLAGITPPVALGSFVAASMAGANPLRTAFTSMRLGVVIYFVPFFFVYSPALILQGSILETLYLFMLCILGIVMIAGGIEDHLVGIGRVGPVARPLLIAAGFLLALPEHNTDVIGAGLAIIVIAVLWRRNKVRQRRDGAADVV